MTRRHCVLNRSAWQLTRFGGLTVSFDAKRHREPRLVAICGSVNATDLVSWGLDGDISGNLVHFCWPLVVEDRGRPVPVFTRFCTLNQERGRLPTLSDSAILFPTIRGPGVVRAIFC